jgi:DNA-binding MarR family transcriptional regulator
MPRTSTSSYRFGDLLALARQSWIAQMAGGLAARGYGEYRRSDAAAVRQLQRGPMSIGRLGAALGVTRQAARKVADGLERRGFATMARDQVDTRQVNVELTRDGEAYAEAVRAVIDDLNGAVMRKVRPDDLAVADAVLRAVLADDHTRRLAEFLGPPPSPPAR